MIYWILLIVFTVAIILLLISCRHYDTLWDIIGGISIPIVVIGGIMVVLSTFQAINEALWSESHKAELLAEREVLEYRLNDSYIENDNNLGATELYNDITEFNSKVMSGREAHANKWTYLFAGSYYNDVDPIELN